MQLDPNDAAAVNDLGEYYVGAPSILGGGPDKAFDLCFVHDLFEHLSLEGLQAAVEEVCRVTRQGICVGFFNMDEIPDHQVHPVDDYHWNRLSMRRMRDLFAACGFGASVVHIGAFLRHQIGCDQTHNPNAYTFLLRPAAGQTIIPRVDG